MKGFLTYHSGLITSWDFMNKTHIWHIKKLWIKFLKIKLYIKLLFCQFYNKSFNGILSHFFIFWLYYLVAPSFLTTRFPLKRGHALFFTERVASRITFIRSQKGQILALFVISDSNHGKCDEICCLSLSIGPLTQQHHLKNVLFEKCTVDLLDLKWLMRWLWIKFPKKLYRKNESL